MILIPNLTNRVIKLFYKKKYSSFVLNKSYTTKRSYNLLFFGSDGIALSSLRKINELR